MNIELTKEQIQEYARLYDDPLSDRMKKARGRGHMELDDLIEVARWKWRGKRTENLCRKNTGDEVRKISETCFKEKSDCGRIRKLLELRGVGWPMASVILHFAFDDEYPILDIRAMRSVGGPKSKHYTCKVWEEYVQLCRDTAKMHGISIRQLDKALWAFDRENPNSRMGS
ncbi:MAG: hypothetical protein OXS40_01580 [Gammaproteobacteria bacterium]|nr:hypothetical protein [Gammaproteobacteria bacterium]